MEADSPKGTTYYTIYETPEDWAEQFPEKEMYSMMWCVGGVIEFTVRGMNVNFLCHALNRDETFTIRKRLPEYLWPETKGV